MGYFEPTYIALYYFEEGSTEPPTVPSDTRVIIDRSVKINGVAVDEYVVKISIVRQLDVAYNTLSMEMRGYILDETFIRNKDVRVEVTIGADEYSFIIIDADATFKNDLSIVGKTQGCLLDKPFSPESTVKMAGNAHDVTTDLMGEVVHVNRTANFSFGKGSFTRDGTSLSAISALLSVSGANYYEAWGEVILEPRFRIKEFDTPNFILNDNILTDRVESSNFDGSPLVNMVVMNSASKDITSDPKITMMIPDDGSKPFFMFNPRPLYTTQINANIGTFSFTTKVITYEGVLNGERTITTDGAIDTINSFEINGTAVTGYTYEAGHNVILLSGDTTGVARISYKTSAVVNYTVNGFYSSAENTRTYKIQYLDQLLEESIPVPLGDDDTNNVPTSPEGDMCYVEVPKNITRDQDFKVIVPYGSLEMFVLVFDEASPATKFQTTPPASSKGSGDTDWFSGGTVQNKTIHANMSATIEDLGNDKYGFYIPKNVDPTEFMLGDSNITMDVYLTSDGVAKVCEIDNRYYVGSNVTVVYSLEGTEYTIPACGNSNTIKSLEIYNCDLNKTVITYPEPSDAVLSCSIPQTFTINVVTLLDVTASSAVGKTITGYGGSWVVDNAGQIYVEVTTYEKVVLDCSAVEKGREIYIDTTNAEV